MAASVYFNREASQGSFPKVVFLIFQGSNFT